MTHTDLLERLALEHDARALMHEYQRLVDAKDVEGLGRLVVDDVLLERTQESRRGRAEFVDLYRAFAASDVEVAQHMVTNVRVSPAGEGRHQIDSCFFVLTTHTSGGARMVWGRYRDDMVRPVDRWLFAAKRISVVRTALIPESSLVAGTVSSFGPMGPVD